MNTEKSNFDPLCNTIWKLSGSGFIFQRDSYPKHWIENTHTMEYCQSWTGLPGVWTSPLLKQGRIKQRQPTSKE